MAASRPAIREPLLSGHPVFPGDRWQVNALVRPAFNIKLVQELAHYTPMA
jgi:hypothetical protein